MIHGIVRDLQARVDVVFRLPEQSEFSVECVVDTGFAGALTLSSETIASLGLPFFQEIDANLANNTDVKTAVFIATILWDGIEAEVAVLAMGNRPLVDTALLYGKRLCASFMEAGKSHNRIGIVHSTLFWIIQLFMLIGLNVTVTTANPILR